MQIATSIETSLWYQIIATLKKEGWRVRTSYEQFDKGIDFDLYEFVKNDEVILCAWGNWFEGEIKASPERLQKLEHQFQTKFPSHSPEYLHRDILVEFKSILKFLRW